MTTACARCGTVYRPESDAPHDVKCAGCGARQQHPRSVPRPPAFRYEAMRHYASEKGWFDGTRLVSNVTGLAVVAACALGAMFLVDMLARRFM